MTPSKVTLAIVDFSIIVCISAASISPSFFFLDCYIFGCLILKTYRIIIRYICFEKLVSMDNQLTILSWLIVVLPTTCKYSCLNLGLGGLIVTLKRSQK